jgi:hypothetical protein
VLIRTGLEKGTLRPTPDTRAGLKADGLGSKTEHLVYEWLRASPSQPQSGQSLPQISKLRVMQDISDLMPLVRVEQVVCSPSSTLLLTSDNRVFAWVSQLSSCSRWNWFESVVMEWRSPCAR